MAVNQPFYRDDRPKMRRLLRGIERRETSGRVASQRHVERRPMMLLETYLKLRLVFP
jgi:hypothetical protein